MVGEYKEKLSTGGSLCITKNSWYIKYYFNGPDLRYNGTFVTLSGVDIDSYIQAWKINFDRYLTLKATIPKGGTFDTAGEMGMSIRVGGWSEGVCLKSYHMPINSNAKLSQVISDYTNAKKRAILVQDMLQKLD